MAVDFKESRTRENLMRAFAGESQARNRYTIAAETGQGAGAFCGQPDFSLYRGPGAGPRSQIL